MSESPDAQSKLLQAGAQQTRTMVRWLLYLSFVVIGYWVLQRLGPVLFPVVAAAGVAYLLDGAVDSLVARGMNRVTVVTALLVTFLLLVGGLILVAVPLISHEIVNFAVTLPQSFARVSAWANNEFGIEVPADWREYLESGQLDSVFKGAAGPAAAMTAAALGGALSMLGFLAELLLVPVFAFYFLVDWDNMVNRAHELVPPRHRELVSGIVKEIDAAVSTWVRGQLIVTTLLGVLYAIVFRLLGVPMGFTIGAIVGLLTVIPFLGTMVGAILTVGVVLLHYNGPFVLIGVGVTFVILHLFEAAFLTPKLVGKKVGLGEVGALFAVLAGGKLLGFTGVLLAVPLAASLAVLLRRAHRYYEDSEFFGEEEDAPASPGDASLKPETLKPET
jgi:predicted PurR-regulated permease PerM